MCWGWGHTRTRSCVGRGPFWPSSRRLSHFPPSRFPPRFQVLFGQDSDTLWNLDSKNNSIILGYNRVETLEKRLKYTLATLGGWHTWTVWMYTTAVGGLVHFYTITWAFLRAFVEVCLWRILREFEIHCRTKTLRIASNLLQKVGFASRQLDSSREWNA
jgi:hypothetical protein